MILNFIESHLSYYKWFICAFLRRSQFFLCTQVVESRYITVLLLFDKFTELIIFRMALQWRRAQYDSCCHDA